MKTRYEIPQGLTDESRWYKYFSLRSLIICLCVAGVGILIGNLIKGLGITIYFIVFWTVITIFITVLTMVKIPNSNWLRGGGEHVDQFVLKVFIRNQKRCLYIKGYDQMKYEQRVKEAFEKEKEDKQV